AARSEPCPRSARCRAGAPARASRVERRCSRRQDNPCSNSCSIGSGGLFGGRPGAPDADPSGVQVVADGARAGLLVVVLPQDALPLLLLELDLLRPLERGGEVFEHAAAEAGAGLAVAADGAHQGRPARPLAGPFHDLRLGRLRAPAHGAHGTALDALAAAKGELHTLSNAMGVQIDPGGPQVLKDHRVGEPVKSPWRSPNAC